MEKGESSHDFHDYKFIFHTILSCIRVKSWPNFVFHSKTVQIKLFVMHIDINQCGGF